MVSLLEYLPIIMSGLLSLSILTLVLGRKNLRLQSEYQIARMIEARVKLESTESFAKMAKESPYYAERFALVESAYIDLYEFIFRLHKTVAIDEQLWSRWASGARAMKSIPKFQAV
jgi:hypothetical protein